MSQRTAAAGSQGADRAPTLYAVGKGCSTRGLETGEDEGVGRREGAA